MTSAQTDQANARCHTYLTEVFNQDPVTQAFWMKFEGNYTQMNLIKVAFLANSLELSVSDLVLKYGFGCEKINVAQMQQAIREENEGYCLDKVMVVA